MVDGPGGPTGGPACGAPDRVQLYITLPWFSALSRYPNVVLYVVLLALISTSLPRFLRPLWLSAADMWSWIDTNRGEKYTFKGQQPLFFCQLLRCSRSKPSILPVHNCQACFPCVRVRNECVLTCFITQLCSMLIGQLRHSTVCYWFVADGC